jgi:hypothetical protein
VTRITTRFGWSLSSLVASAMMPTDQEEDEMQKITTLAIILVAAAITTAWSVSTAGLGGPNRGADTRGGGGFVPVRSVVLW